jgi:predicted ATP-grasp superfamily ATP-dependent carboligase
MTAHRLEFKPLRILLSEGSSTSAREAVTALGLAGHIVEACDPAPFGLARFSRFVRAWHRCPGLRDDPQAFLVAVEQLLARKYDVLLPIHEQGFALAKVQSRFAGRVGLALPSFESYRVAHCKAGFSRLLTELGLPQPATAIVNSADEARRLSALPCVIKTAIGTASRGVWMVRDVPTLERALSELDAAGEFAGEVLVQALVAGFTEKAQGVFCRGAMVGFHATRQIVEGAGGGDAIRRSVRRDRIRADLGVIGRHLGWHGALSVDWIMPDDGSGPFYIDCNPRLVEPMAATLAGVDLVDLLLRVSLGERPAAVPDGRVDVVTHQAMQVLLGCAQRGGTRRKLLGLWRDLARRRGAFAGSVEELTPVRLDRPSAVPLAMTALLLLMSPKLADVLSRRGWGAHLLDRHSIAAIECID